MTLNWQTWHMRFVAGLNQGNDPRTLEAPELAVCKDVMFDKTGTLQTRYPFALTSNNIFGGGTLADHRRIVENGSELLCFTKDALYSWNAQLSKWVLKGTHLAVKVEEEPVFIATGEQYGCDRAELDGTIVYVWSDETKGGIVAAAIDKETGATLVPPTYFLFSGVARVVALDTRILLITSAPGIGALYGTRVRAIDPADPATGIASTATSVIAGNILDGNPDVVRIPGSDAAILACATTSGYTVATVTAGLTVTTSAKTRTADDDAIAVAVDPTSANALVIRCENTGSTDTDPRDIKCDRIDASTLADITTDTALGTSSAIVNQITAAFRSAQTGGSYRAYAFWSDSENAQPQTSGGVVVSNWIDLTDTTGTASTFVPAFGVASRAFDHDGSVYVNLVFAGDSNFLGGPLYGQRSQLQNTYFLYRDDAFLVAKTASGRAGGFCVTQGHLPGVALTGTATYSWCGTERRIVPLGGKAKGYADRGPRDITFTFDSNEARRCVRLGKTLYITGGEILQYDGARLAEVGSHYYPYFFEGNPLGAGGLEIGTYAYKATYRYQNARGEVERSTTATVGGAQVFNTVDAQMAITNIGTLVATHKTENPPAIELWRTLKNPTDDAPFYLVTSNDPTNAATTNSYVANDSTASLSTAIFVDTLSDEVARDLETNPENGAVLESLSPPPATIIASTATRLFLAGIAGDPDRVWYSKQRNDGEVAAFHDALVADIPQQGGALTALAVLDGTVIVFRERAIYALVGDGYDNAGGGQNFVAREVSHDIGAVSQESIVVTERGVFFHSSKGKWLLNKGWQLEYIGGNVMDFDDETPLAVHAIATRHEIRWLTPERMLVLNTLAGQWSEWTIADGLDACMWNGTHVYLSSTGPRQEQTTYTGVDYGMVVETAWVKLGDLQNYGKVDHFLVLGEYRSAHRLQIQCARDYWKDGDGTFFHDKTWTVSPTTVGARESVEHAPSIKQVEAIKIRITALGPGTDAAPSGEALKLTGLSFEIGFERGLNRQLPSAQRQ